MLTESWHAAQRLGGSAVQPHTAFGGLTDNASIHRHLISSSTHSCRMSIFMRGPRSKSSGVLAVCCNFDSAHPHRHDPNRTRMCLIPTNASTHIPKVMAPNPIPWTHDQLHYTPSTECSDLQFPDVTSHSCKVTRQHLLRARHPTIKG